MIYCVLTCIISPRKVMQITAQLKSFHTIKVHIKYEKRKNVAITLSIKDLKGLLEVV